MSRDVGPDEWGKALLETAGRQAAEIIAARESILAEIASLERTFSKGSAIDARELHRRMLHWIGHAYEIGRRHRSEDLRVRLAVDAEVDVVVVVAPPPEGRRCPAEPHAHLRFTAGEAPTTAHQPDARN